jgi:hypothetical protein
VVQEALFCEFSLKRNVPSDGWVRGIGRPSIDPDLMIRMLLIGCCFGIRSERRLSEEAHLNLAYRWSCRLGLEVSAPDYSIFSKNRHGCFRDSGLLCETSRRPSSATSRSLDRQKSIARQQRSNGRLSISISQEPTLKDCRKLTSHGA